MANVDSRNNLTMVFWRDSLSRCPLGEMPILFRIASCSFEYFIIIKKIYMWYDIEIVSLVPFG